MASGCNITLISCGACELAVALFLIDRTALRKRMPAIFFAGLRFLFLLAAESALCEVPGPYEGAGRTVLAGLPRRSYYKLLALTSFFYGEQ